jgi:hypothetical protein
MTPTRNKKSFHVTGVRNNKKSTMDFVVEYNHKESEGFQVAPSTTEPYSAHQTDSGAIGVQEETPN